MPEDDVAGAGTPEDLDARLALLGAEIDEAERRLARLRHEGERHYIDDQPVHPDVTDALRQLVAKSEELDALRRLRTPGTTPVNPPYDAPPGFNERLAQLEARIAKLRHIASGDPHKSGRHFIDG